MLAMHFLLGFSLLVLLYSLLQGKDNDDDDYPDGPCAA